ncbi:MAG: type II secretion system minor pseudopilin GspI [Chromatiales bacterium]|nr:type II secretion system minor pseudopilin GspI [Chromatiales bacterium]
MRQRGFTLMEVLVAVVVLAVALGALIRAGSQNASTAAYLQERTLAHWTADNALAQLRAGLVPLTEGTRQDEAEMAGRRYDLRIAVAPARSPHEMLPDPQGLYEVTVEVRPRDADIEETPLARLTGFVGVR